MSAKSVARKRLFAFNTLWMLLALAILAALEATLLAASAGADTLHVCPAGPPTCDYDSIQDAVDAASDGSTIKVAEGIYTGLQDRPAPAGYEGPASLSQIVYLTKTVTIRGGYAVGDWTTPDPEVRPTTLDARGQGRVLFVAGEVAPVLDGLRLTGGDATDLGGTWWTDAGGGAYVLEASATISHCLFYENVAGSSEWGGTGGGLFLASSPSTVHSTTIRGNFASEAGEGYGGGLALDASDALILDNVIHDNVASTGDWGFGGGAHLYASNATLSGNEFYANTASEAAEGYGGGLYVDGAAPSVTGNTIRDNVASVEFDGYGGGLALNDASATIRGNTVKGNSATASGSSYGYGGGLDLWQSEATLDRNVIQMNVAGVGEFGYGGGLSLANSKDKFVNNAVIDNQAGGNGAGFYVEGGAPTLFHTTIARNAGGDASGLYLTHSGALALTNTILASQATGIVVNTGSTASVDGVLWYANTSDSGGDGTFSASNATTGDPAFAADGYHILSRSAAIDAGIDAKVEEDIDGQPRPYRTADLGADEYWPSGTTSRIFLPLMLSGHH